MFEYKVEIVKAKDAEELMNKYAKEGWRVIAVSTYMTMTQYNLAVTFEREQK